MAMAFFSHFLIASALLICLCPAYEYFSIHDQRWSKILSEQTEPTGPQEIKFEPVDSSLIIESTSLTNSVPVEPVETTSAPEPTSGQTAAPTSQPAQTTSVPELTSDQTKALTSQPVETTSAPEPTSYTVTSKTITTTTSESSSPTHSISFTTVELLWCHNGGTFNGKDCICPVGLNGRTCRSIETFASDTLNRSVEVNLVINEAFDDNYEDKASFEYKEFAGNFTHQMDIYYKENKIPHFKEVLITSVSREGPLGRLSQSPVGEMRSSDEAIRTRADSVRVTHDVVLVISNNANSGPLYESSFQAVSEAVGKLVDCPKDCPYPVTVQPIVKGTTLDVGSVCNKLVKDPIIAYYYESVPVDGTVTCATVCSSHHSSPKECYNEGLCRVHKDTGPICECQSVNSTWYLDKDCRFPIQKIPFYAGLSLTFFCLLMTVVGLMAYVLMGKHKQIQQTGDGKEKLDQWLYEDAEWVRSHSSTDIRNAGNRDSNPFSNSNPAFPHRDLFSNLSMSVSGPQIRPSCDA